MDHAGWLQQNVEHQLSDLEVKIADIVGMTFGGIYNAPITFHRGWKPIMGGRGLEVVVGCRSMATFDFASLTRLVFLCHEARIRCEINAHTRGYWLMRFFQRAAGGSAGERHPNLAEAIVAFREYLPADHRIIYRPEGT